jgi:UDP-glucose 6-dehydrogenase
MGRGSSGSSRATRVGRLPVGTDRRVVPTSDVVVIAVGTQARRRDGFACLSSIEPAAGEAAGSLDPPAWHTVSVTKSAGPVGPRRYFSCTVSLVNRAAEGSELRVPPEGLAG